MYSIFKNQKAPPKKAYSNVMYLTQPLLLEKVTPLTGTPWLLPQRLCCDGLEDSDAGGLRHVCAAKFLGVLMWQKNDGNR